MFDPSKSKVVSPTPQETALLGSKKVLSRREMLLRCGGTAFGALTLPGCTANTPPFTVTSGGTGGGGGTAAAPTFVRAGSGVSQFGNAFVMASFSTAANVGDYLVLAVAADNTSGGTPPTITTSGWTRVLTVSAALNVINLYIFVNPSAPANLLNVTAQFINPDMNLSALGVPTGGAYSAIVVDVAPVSGSNVAMEAHGTATNNLGQFTVSTTTATTHSDLMLGFVANSNNGITFNNPYEALFANDIGNNLNSDINGATTTVTNGGVQTMSGSVGGFFGVPNWVAALMALYG